MPHDSVLKIDSFTRNLRVEIDASSTTISGTLWNYQQFAGSTIQESLFFIYLRSKKQKYIFCADIVKKYVWFCSHRNNVSSVSYGEEILMMS